MSKGKNVKLKGNIMPNKVKQEVFPEIIDIYNMHGCTAAYDFIRSTYSIRNPYYVIKRIKESSEFVFDAQNNKFIPTSMGNAENCFMSLEELCKPETHPSEHVRSAESRNAALNAMITNLISDKLLELSRYVTIDSVSRVVRIDSLSIKENGYRMVIAP